MLTDWPVLTTASLFVSLIASGCAGNSPSGPSLTAPTVQSTAATAPLRVEIDTICAGRESNIRVFVDAVQVGVTNPGDAGVSQIVTVGSHQLSAVSDRGTLWGPFPTIVGAAGQVERLGCMPFDAI
jgi:hypothetical protein